MTAQRTLADRYELTSPIARGGMGQVWAAYDKRLDRRVAVKLFRPDGSVVVLDFGVAALLDPEITSITATGEALGSPAYMSPEQVKGVQASPRSDLYALGCILHELLAGSRPFMADGTYAAMREHAVARADADGRVGELLGVLAMSAIGWLPRGVRPDLRAGACPGSGR